MSEAVVRTGRAERVIATLRAHEAELRAAGVKRLSLFGSVARGEDGPASDVDLIAAIDREAGIGYFELMGIERRIAKMLGEHVDLLTEPVQKPRLRIKIDRDRRDVF